MIQPFHEITSFEGDEWQEFLDRICLLDIFMPVIKAYPEVDTLKCVIKYIVYAYSKDSDKIVLGMEWEKNKKMIFDSVGVKPERGLLDDLVYLKNEAVLETVNKWLDSQQSDVFKGLQVLKDLRVEMQISSLTAIRKSSGEIDYSQKYLNAEYATKLKAMIKDLEDEFIQNDPKMTDGIKEVNQKNNIKKNSRSVGSYAVR